MLVIGGGTEISTGVPSPGNVVRVQKPAPHTPTVLNTASEIAPEVIRSRSGCAKGTVAVTVKEGVPDLEHVKEWTARGRLVSKEAK